MFYWKLHADLKRVIEPTLKIILLSCQMNEPSEDLNVDASLSHSERSECTSSFLCCPTRRSNTSQHLSSCSQPVGGCVPGRWLQLQLQTSSQAPLPFPYTVLQWELDLAHLRVRPPLSTLLCRHTTGCWPEVFTFASRGHAKSHTIMQWWGTLLILWTG